MHESHAGNIAVCSVCGLSKRPGLSKRHDQICCICGKHFCPGRSCGGATTCSPACKHQLQSRLSKHNWVDDTFRSKCSANNHLPLCPLCGNKIARNSQKHNRLCVICGTAFCAHRDTCSVTCTKVLQSRVNSTHWEDPAYREKQANHNSRSAQAGKESAEAREIRGLLGLREHEISKFGYRWDGWWPERKIFWEHQGCCWHYCVQCGFDHPFKDGGKLVAAKRRSDLRKKQTAEANGWSVFYTWSHDFKIIRKDPVSFFESKLGFAPIAIEIASDLTKPLPKCSREGCEARARPGRTTCSDQCYQVVRQSGAARLNEANAVTARAIVCERPGCGQMVANPKYHNKECKGCGRRFCIKNQTHISEFHSLGCYFKWQRSQICTKGGRRHLITNESVHQRQCEHPGCERRFCGYRRFCPEHTKERIATANSAAAQSQWADPRRKAKLMRGIRAHIRVG